MKNVTIKLAVLSTLSLITAQAWATGLVSIPTTGFTGTAYTLCNTTGNFGSSLPTQPTTGANNTCAIFPGSELNHPGYGLYAATATRPAVINGVTVGQVTDRVFRNGTSCLFVTKFTANNNDRG